MHTHARSNAFTHAHVSRHARTHACPATHTRKNAAHTHVRTYVRTYTHRYTYRNKHTHASTHARTCNLIKNIIITMLTKLIRFQGKLEERNPFVSIRLPPSFEKDYPTAAHNLRTNSRRLTSPFDIHATFLDILNYTTVLHGNLSHVCILVR